jgi:hypothetical protein
MTRVKRVLCAIVVAGGLTAAVPAVASAESAATERAPVPEHTGYWQIQVPIPWNGWKGFAYYACRDRTNYMLSYLRATGHRVYLINYCANASGAYYISTIKYTH